MNEADYDAGTIGKITREHTVWCGVCGNWHQIADERKRVCIRQFRKMGWKNTRDRGWVCNRCLPNLQTL